jgi:hypothetical protein
MFTRILVALLTCEAAMKTLNPMVASLWRLSVG